jgi:hypothetical protein
VRLQSGMGQSFSVEGRGQSLLVILSQLSTSTTPWTLAVYARTGEARTLLGTIVTNPPAITPTGRPVDPPVRVVAICGVPGGAEFEILATAPTVGGVTEQAEIYGVLSPELACTGVVQPIVGTSGLPGSSCSMRALDLTAPVLSDMFPGVAALGLGFDSVNQVWRPFAVDALGHLIVNIVLGAATVNTAAAAPTDPGGLYLGAAAEGYTYDATAGLWRKAVNVDTTNPTDPGGRYLGVASDAYLWDGIQWRRQIGTGLGEGIFLVGQSQTRDLSVDPLIGGILPGTVAFGAVYDGAQWHKIKGLSTGEPVVSRIDGSTIATYIGTLGDNSPAAAGIAAGAATLTGFGAYENATVILEGLGATGGILNVRVQHKPRAAVADWYDLIAFNSIAATTAAAEGIQSSHVALTGVPNKIGKNLAPRLTPGTTCGGLWGNEWRLIYDALAGTSAGAAQVAYFFAHKLR